MHGTIIQTEAGVATFIKGVKPVDVEPLLADALKNEIPFVYLRGADEPENNEIAVAPQHVAALILSP